jgi:ribosomal protein S18 acetylase RimI-like enzyme
MHSSPVLRLATHTDMHAIWQIDADVFGEDVYPGFFFRQAMDLWPELLVVAEREGRLLGYALGAWSGSVAGLAALLRGASRSARLRPGRANDVAGGAGLRNWLSGSD